MVGWNKIVGLFISKEFASEDIFAWKSENLPPHLNLLQQAGHYI